MLELRGRIALSVDVGRFFQLQRVKRHRVAGAATEMEHVSDPRQLAGEPLDLRLEHERLLDQQGDVVQCADELLLLRIRQHAPPPTSSDRQACERRQLASKRLGRRAPISGPASVGMTTSLAQAIVGLSTLTTERMCCPWSPASCGDASVSAVSPD